MSGLQRGTPSVSVVVPVFNRGRFLPSLVQALKAQTVSVEIILVDDGSTDDPFRDLQADRLRCVRQENRGPAAARNHGARLATGEVVAFTDSDCRPHPDWIEQLLVGFDAPEVGAVAGSYDIINTHSLLACLIQEDIRTRHAGFGCRVRAFGSYNVALKRDLFLELGGFDESFRRASGEDNDLSYRLLEKGYGIRFQPDALVGHHHPECFGRYLLEQRRHGIWRMKIYRRHSGRISGDDYTGWRDILEIPWVLAVLAGLLLLIAGKGGRRWYLAILFAMPLWQSVDAGWIARRRGEWYPLLLVPFWIARAFARTWGALEGIGRFWLNWGESSMGGLEAER